MKTKIRLFALASLLFATFKINAQWAILGNAATNPPTNFVGTTDAKALVFKTNATEWMRILTTGEVGIGTTAPTSILHTVASGAKTTAYTGNLLTNIATSSTNNIVKAGLEIKSTGTWNGTSSKNVGIYVSAVSGGTLNFDALFMGGGNVGVGTSLPQRKFVVSNGLQGMEISPNATYCQMISYDRWNSVYLPLVLQDATGGDVGIGTTTPGAKLEVNGQVKITGGAPGLGKVLTSDANGLATWSSSSPTGGWSITGNSGTTAGTNFIGTTDTKDLVFKTNNTEVMRIDQANSNLGIGTTTPGYKLDVNGDINIGASNAYKMGGTNILNSFGSTSCLFVGQDAGANFGSGGSFNNTFVGYNAGYLTGATSGSSDNTFLGYESGYNTGNGGIGQENTFVGSWAGYSNVSGGDNDFFGQCTGKFNTTGNFNTFIGHWSGTYNTTCSNNTSLGAYSLGKQSYGVTTLTNNVAIGNDALYNNNPTATTNSGSYNTAVGYQSGYLNTTGYDNTFLGYTSGALYTTGNNNTFLGYGADANGNGYSNATALGNGAIAPASNTITLGNTTIATIYAQVTSITSISDGRFKTNIKEDVKGLAFINKLRPVTYTLDTKKLDDYEIQNMPDSVKKAHQSGMDFGPTTAIIHSGFIAQEVEEAAKQTGFKSSIVHHPTNNTDPYGVGYSEIVVPLVKAVQEQQKMIEVLDSTIKAQNSKIENMQNQTTNTDSKTSPTNSSSSSGNNGNGISDISSNATAILYQNIPNPFSQQTSIQYFIPGNAHNASILVFDLNGKLMNTVPVTSFGKASVVINGNQLNPGMFVYSLVVDGKIVDTKRMILTQ